MGINPAELEAIVAQLEAQAAEVDRLFNQLTPPRGDVVLARLAYPLVDVQMQLGSAAKRIAVVGAILKLVLEQRSRPHCHAEYGCCPEHGATLRSVGTRTWCIDPECNLEWDWDRHGLPCLEPPAFRMVKPEAKGLVCKGHAVAALKLLAGTALEPLSKDDRG